MNSQKKKKTNLLIFVVGTSGSGKDSVMRETITFLNSQKIPASTLKRIITRPPDKNEESTFMSTEEFLKLQEENELSLSWYIYDNWYGCEKTPIERALDRDELLLINVSRSMLFKAREVFPDCLIVLVTVPKEIAESRIKKRGREDDKGLQIRLSRMKKDIEIPTPNKIVENTGDLNKTAEELGKFLKSHYLAR
ncbi:MAG: hypothetical protein ACW98F_07010 [Candidatus Hodarchaeales archaeon]|jgi:ribose 1,5-bisphosphokinase